MSFGAIANAHPDKIEVFYDGDSGVISKVNIDRVEVIYYQLDKASLLQAEINKKLPSTLEQASSFINKYKNSDEGKQKIKAIVESYQWVGRAYSLGVTKLPAVVIDERLVIYGTTNVNLGLLMWEKHQRGSNE